MKILLTLLALVSLQAVAEPTSIFRQAEISVSSATEIAPATGYRRYLLIQNKGNQSVYIKFGSAPSGTDGIEIPSGGNYEPLRVDTQIIHAIAASGTQSVVVVEGK